MLANLNPEQREVRRRMGCDVNCEEGDEEYGITCPRCDGAVFLSDGPCPVCSGNGRYAGKKLMRRCPRSFVTPDISAALDAMGWAKNGTLPIAGGYLEQSPTFLQFYRIVEGEVASVRAEIEEQQRVKRQRKARRRGR